MTHICIGKLTNIHSDSGNAEVLLIGPLANNFSEDLIVNETFSFKKIHLKISSGKFRSYCLGLNVLKIYQICFYILPQ